MDSNVLIYRAVEDSEFHVEAKRVLDRLDRWIVPTIVVHETLWGLRELLGRGAALRFVEALLSHRKTRVEPVLGRDVVFAVGLVGDEGLSVFRYNDKLILSVALRLGESLFSFDRQLLSQAGRVGVPVISHYG